jgi:thiamine pyrophosphokinase
VRAFVVASSPKAIEPDQHVPQPGDVVIAADGGANWCRAWQWPVSVVVGDMDSIREDVAAALRGHGVPFHAYPIEKDETDLEIALGYALEHAASEIVVAGALGARIDHTLGNLTLLALPALRRTETCIVDDAQTIWLVRDRLTVHGRPGDTLSLIPFGGDASGVSLSGVYWPLDGAGMPFGPSLGISNRMTADRAEVEIESGSLLVVHTRTSEEKDQ